MDLLQVLDQSLYREVMETDFKSLTNPSSPMKNLSSNLRMSHSHKESKGLKRKFCDFTEKN